MALPRIVEVGAKPDEFSAYYGATDFRKERSMPILQDAQTAYRAIRRGVRRRKYRTQVIAVQESRGAYADHHFRIALYYPDSRKNLYQVRQWLYPLEQLHKIYPVVIMTRSASAALTIMEMTELPVVWFRYISDVEEFVTRQALAVVFYVNQSAKNFQMLGFPTPAHIHINHGESDKISMASNHVKAYDYAFIAGQAGYDRITKNLIGIDKHHLVEIGRPQVDIPADGPNLHGDGRTVVFYSPTWEGDRPGMAYGSVASHGLAIVNSLLADPTVRLVYRPHPRTGTVDRDYGKVSAAICARIEEANRTDPGAKHIADIGSPFGWQTHECDVCICDISAVAFDWLATAKPLIMTRPVSPDAVVDTEGIVSAVTLLTAENAGGVDALVRDVQASGMGTTYTELVRYHFGDVTPGTSMRRFLEATQKVVDERVRAQAEREAHLERVIGH